MASTLTTFAAGLKTRYTDQMVENLSQRDNVLLGLLRKNDGFSGDGLKVPIIYANPQGISGSRSNAQTYATNAKLGAFTLTVGELDGEVEIGNKVLEASRDNKGAFLENKVVEIDGLYAEMGNTIDVHLHGNGGFALGKVGSIDTPTNVITLSDAYTAAFFEYNMEIEASTADGTSGSLKTGTQTIAAISRENGTLTVDDWQAIDTPTGIVANDYIFRAGTFGQTTGVDIVEGLGSYIYSTSTSVPALLGLTRSTDPDRLAGVRVPSTAYTGKSLEARLQLLGNYMVGRNAGPGGDVGLLNPEDWQSLALALQSRGIRPAQDTSTKFGYMAIEAVLGGRMVKIYPDRHQPKGLAFLLKMNTWTLYSMGKLIHPIQADGLTMLRKATTNDYAYRLISYPQLGCNAPGYNGRIPLTG